MKLELVARDKFATCLNLLLCETVDSYITIKWPIGDFDDSFTAVGNIKESDI